MIKQLVRKCPICGSLTGAIIGNLDFALFDDCPLSRSFDLVSCDKCYFVFYDTPNTAQQYAEFYRNHYFSSSYISKSNIASIDAVVNSRCNPVDVLKDYLEKKSVICEIGCGRGALLFKFKEAGYSNVYGVDPSNECVNLIKDKYNINAVVGTAEDVSLNINFDIVISTHAIEHILDISKAISNMASLIKDNGVFYIEVPDIDGYDSQKISIPKDYMTFFDHINHFDADSLQRLLWQHGFAMIKHGKKVLNEGTSLPMPTLYGVFQKKENAVEKHVFSKNNQLARIEKLKSWMDSKWINNDELVYLSEENIPTYVWGVNLPMQKMLAMSPLKKCNIVSLVDNDQVKQKKSVNGMKVQSPNVLLNISSEQTAVVIWRGPYCESIKEELFQMNYKGKIIIL